MNITEEKTRFVFVVCCVLVTAAIIFNTVAAFIQRNNIENAIWSGSTNVIDRNLEEISDHLEEISDNVEMMLW
jgi:hypothetical protein